jgi:hypothetical protein
MLTFTMTDETNPNIKILLVRKVMKVNELSGVNSGALKGQAVTAPVVTNVFLLLLPTLWSIMDDEKTVITTN